MAIDTRNKRFSLLGLGLDALRVRPNPDGSFATNGDRGQLLPLWRGFFTSDAGGSSSAVDTRDKRFSMIGVGLESIRVRPNPDGSFATAGDRAHLMPRYRGPTGATSAGRASFRGGYVLADTFTGSARFTGGKVIG